MRVASLFTLLLLVACGDGYVERSTQVRFGPGGADFWAVPLPSSLRKGLGAWPGPRSAAAERWLAAFDARVRDGWGVSAGAFFPLTGPVDAVSLPSPSETLTLGAAVQLIDVDPDSPEYGRRVPVEVRAEAGDGAATPAHALSVVPVAGFPLRPATQYAAVVAKGLRDGRGEALGASRDFHAALEQSADAAPEVVEALRPLRKFLDWQRWPRTQVVGGTVFRTLDPTAATRALARWAEARAEARLLTPWRAGEGGAGYARYEATVALPRVQAGAPSGLGAIAWDADGVTPLVQGEETVRLVLALPTSAAPAGGFPLTLLLHDTGRSAADGVERGLAALLARAGLASLGFDLPLQGARAVPGVQWVDPLGPRDGALDAAAVGAMEVLLLARLAGTLDVGGARVDAARLSALGHGLGSVVGVAAATVDSRLGGWVFAGAGGLLLEGASGTGPAAELSAALRAALELPEGQGVPRGHPLLFVAQSVWDLVDPVARARHVAVAPLEGRGARPIFLPLGVPDLAWPPGAQAALGGALGVTLVGRELDAALPRTLRLQGRGTLAGFPLRGTLNGVTVGAVQVAAVGDGGHDVVFLDEGTQAQVACFLAGVGTAEGPAIVSPRALDAGCE